MALVALIQRLNEVYFQVVGSFTLLFLLLYTTHFAIVQFYVLYEHKFLVYYIFSLCMYTLLPHVSFTDIVTSSLNVMAVQLELKPSYSLQFTVGPILSCHQYHLYDDGVFLTLSKEGSLTTNASICRVMLLCSGLSTSTPNHVFYLFSISPILGIIDCYQNRHHCQFLV